MKRIFNIILVIGMTLLANLSIADISTGISINSATSLNNGSSGTPSKYTISPPIFIDAQYFKQHHEGLSYALGAGLLLPADVDGYQDRQGRIINDNNIEQASLTALRIHANIYYAILPKINLFYGINFLFPIQSSSNDKIKSSTSTPTTTAVNREFKFASFFRPGLQIGLHYQWKPQLVLEVLWQTTYVYYSTEYVADNSSYVSELFTQGISFGARYAWW